MRTIFLIMLSALVLGCQTPYSGDLGPQDYYGDGIDFDGWETYNEDGIVCYENGFDRYCVKTITHLIEKIIEIIVIKEKRVEIPIDRIVEKYIFLQETIYKDREPTLEETVEFVETEVEVYYGEDNTGDPVEVFTNTPIKDVISEIEQTPIPPISEPPSETTIGDIKTETPVEQPVEETPVEQPVEETPVAPPPETEPERSEAGETGIVQPQPVNVGGGASKDQHNCEYYWLYITRDDVGVANGKYLINGVCTTLDSGNNARHPNERHAKKFRKLHHTVYNDRDAAKAIAEEMMREARIDLGLPAFAIEGFENQQHDSHHGPTYSGTSNYQYTVDVTYSAFGKEKHIRREDNNALKKGESKPININYIMDTNHLSKKVKVPRWFQTGDVDTYSIFRNGNSVLFQGLISISQVNNKLATVSPFEQNKITVKAHGETQVTAPDIDKYHKHGGKIHAHGHVHNLNP